MTDINRINCPSCGSAPSHKKIDEDYICEYCGTKYHIKNSGEKDFSRAGAEMTVRRLREEIAQINRQYAASFQEFEQLKKLIDNPSFSVKYKKYWWTIPVLALVLFIIAISTDAPALGGFSILFFISGFLFLIHGLRKTVLWNNSSKRYAELSLTVIPAREQITIKQDQIKKHLIKLD